MAPGPDTPDDESGPPPAELPRLLTELEELRRAGIFTEEQFEDERRRLEREARRDRPSDRDG